MSSLFSIFFMCSLLVLISSILFRMVSFSFCFAVVSSSKSFISRWMSSRVFVISFSCSSFDSIEDIISKACVVFLFLLNRLVKYCERLLISCFSARSSSPTR